VQAVSRNRLIDCLGLFSVAACTFACHPSDQTAHSVNITGRIHVYKTAGPPASYPGADFIAELGPSDHPAVLEAVSGNGYRAAKVRLADGREGWVFSGESVEIK